MKLNSGPAYLVTITRLTEVRRLRVGDGPYTITISTIDLSQLLGDNIVTTSVLGTFSLKVAHSEEAMVMMGATTVRVYADVNIVKAEGLDE
jgi:hypothetical protein